MNARTVRSGILVRYVLTISDAAMINSEKHNRFKLDRADDVHEVRVGDVVTAAVVHVSARRDWVKLVVRFDDGETYHPHAARYSAEQQQGTWHSRAEIEPTNIFDKVYEWIINLLRRIEHTPANHE